ncbi:MAG: transposase [Planctomycetota bacterium]|nr:transposase [Planctomycetota bacterium]MDA1114723.1 transposase [Planctomycetota bacterium]
MVFQENVRRLASRAAGPTFGTGRFLGVGLVLGCSLLLGACAEPEPEGPTTPPNIILISMDTLRADHMACYGHEIPNTPVLDGFLEQATRPPLATERLSLLPDGRVAHELRRPWRDGTTHMLFDPLTFIERLAALVPRPRRPLLTYHGVLAPAASWRDSIVPADPDDSPTGCPHSENERPPRRWGTWAELMKRAFEVDVLVCTHCGGARKLISLITDPAVIRRIVAHLKLPLDFPMVAPPRAPPEPALPLSMNEAAALEKGLVVGCPVGDAVAGPIAYDLRGLAPPIP